MNPSIEKGDEKYLDMNEQYVHMCDRRLHLLKSKRQKRRYAIDGGTEKARSPPKGISVLN